MASNMAILAIYIEFWGGTLVSLLPFGACFLFKILSAQTSCHKTSLLEWSNRIKYPP